MRRLSLLMFLVVVTACYVCRGQQEGYVDFSFDQADIGSFVKLVGAMTGKKFVVADDVKGKITIVSPSAVKREDVFPLFVSILESTGCSIKKQGDLYQVVNLPNKPAAIGTVVGPDEATPTQGIVTKIVHLKDVSALEFRKNLEGMGGLGKSGAIVAIEETNHVLLTGTASFVKQIEKIIAEIDKPGMARATEVISLKFASAGDLANELNTAMSESESRAEQLKSRLPAVPGMRSGRKRGVVVPSPHSNSLILVGTHSQNERPKSLIAQMDIDSPSGRGRLNAIFLKYMSAEEAAKSINELLLKLEQKGTSRQPSPQARRIAVAASPANNALIVDALPGDFDVVKRLIEQLDLEPEQVQVTVLIVEHSISDDFDFGITLEAMDSPSSVGDTVTSGSMRLGQGSGSLINSIVKEGIFPRGITAGVIHGTGMSADGTISLGYPGAININAIKADGRFDIVDETSLEAQNNKEASVSVVNQIPILTSTISPGTGTNREVIQNIERIDVGIKLKFTPHVIPGGDVQMDLNPIIEAVIDVGASGMQFTPTIARREVSTTVIVPDGGLSVIAGLTRDNELEVTRKVPLLGSIPILGWLFTSKSVVIEKRNLAIFVSPRIVKKNSAEAVRIVEDWERKVGLGPDEKK